MKTITCALALLWTVSVQAQSSADLRRDIAALKPQITQKRSTVEALSRPHQKSSALHVGFSARPIIELVKEINALPEAQRRVDFAVIAANGQLWGWDADCVIFGKKYSEEGAYVEFKDPNYRVEANARMSNLDASWIAGQGLRFNFDAAAHLGVGMIHGHRKPCVGGGVGGDGGPMTCDASARLSTLTSMGLANNALSYASAINLNDINYSCSINLGSFGTLTIEQIIKVPGNVAFNGTMPLPVSTAGVLESSDGRIRKAYEIRLVNPSLALTSEGVDVGTNVAIAWQ